METRYIDRLLYHPKFIQKLEELHTNEINIDALQVPFIKLRPNADMPRRGSEYAAGFDLTTCEAEELSGGKVRYYTGIAMAIPHGYVGKIYARSSVHKMDLRLSNCVGIIDSDYRREISFIFDVTGQGNVYENGDRIGQIIIEKLEPVYYTEVDELDDTERGTGGFGSTGK